MRVCVFSECENYKRSLGHKTKRRNNFPCVSADKNCKTQHLLVISTHTLKNNEINAENLFRNNLGATKCQQKCFSNPFSKPPDTFSLLIQFLQTHLLRCCWNQIKQQINQIFSTLPCGRQNQNFGCCESLISELIVATRIY